MHVLSPKNVILDSKYISIISNLIEACIGNACQKNVILHFFLRKKEGVNPHWRFYYNEKSIQIFKRQRTKIKKNLKKITHKLIGSSHKPTFSWVFENAVAQITVIFDRSPSWNTRFIIFYSKNVISSDCNFTDWSKNFTVQAALYFTPLCCFFASRLSESVGLKPIWNF